MNAVQYNMWASSPGDSASVITLTGAKVHKMRNNIGFPNKNSYMMGVDSTFNTWDLGITEASTDFVSTADTGALGPRQADGSLPAIDFMKLRAKSPLIDKGTNVMLPYVGAAPDLGAYEFGATTTGGTAGAGSAGAGNPGAGNPGAGGTGSAGRGGNPGTVNGGSASELGGSGSSEAGADAGADAGAFGTPTPGTAGAPNLPGAGSTGASVAGTGASAGSSDMPAGAPEEAGCACSAGKTGRQGALSAVFLAGLLALLSRRRRR
jgi:MYXO-CTERM domain-containing protein